ncbi:hypothetical protein FD755_024238 [Muntiacus reevesi]|uniref:Core shell protein Gag P30 domain-containing protein n=1 Tax=Muntiacus reevesi TaxID=9886 RepID=A0A5N3V9Z5_MUNRE|nr:hypothetical protein FD755_024238 [Muntiacus reevesi]
MGGSGSKATVLENMIKNFKKGFDGDYGKKMTPGRLRTLCEVEWPSMGVGWPPEGTMDLNLIKAVYAIVTGKPGHPDQFPYIDSWLGIAQDPPKWACFYAHGGEGKILMAQKITEDEKEILQDPEGDELPPPPYWMMVPPATPQVVEPPSRQAPTSTGGAMSPPDSTTPDAAPTFPKLYPPLPVSSALQKSQRKKIPLQMPLREVQQPPMIGEDPFSSTDILNWQKHTPSYSKWLQEMVPEGTANPERWIEQAFPTDRPNWDYNTEEGKIQLERYRTAIIQGLRRGARRPMDMSKPARIVQKGNESPSKFYRRLCEAYRLYTPIDPEATGSQIVINPSFIAQAFPDIKRKLQKTEFYPCLALS